MKDVSRSARTLTAVVVVAAGTMVLAPSPAAAHALCGETSPARNSTLDQPPSNVWCEFNEPPTPSSSIEVYDGCEQRVDNGRSLVTGTRITVLMDADEPGVYTVVWKTVSAKDGHPAFGSHVFTVRGTGPCAPSVGGSGNGGSGNAAPKGGGGTRDGTPKGPASGDGQPGATGSPGPVGSTGPGPRTDGEDDGGAGDDGGNPSGGIPGDGIPGEAGVIVGLAHGPSVGKPLIVLIAVVLPFGLIPARALRRRSR